MQKALNRIEAIFVWTAVGVAAAIMVLTTADALGRYLFIRPIVGAFEITADYLLVALVFLAASYSYRTGSFVRVTIVIDKVRGRAHLAGNYIAQIVSILVAGGLVVAAALQARRTFATGTLSNSLIPYPLGPAHVLASLGLFMMTVRLIADLSRVKSGESGMLREESEGF
jgi:TRAP-type C4-dicarboxylate transport system permease small subunit